MGKSAIANLCERGVLPKAARLYGTSAGALSKFPDTEGCANLVYQYEREGLPRPISG